MATPGKTGIWQQMFRIVKQGKRKNFPNLCTAKLAVGGRCNYRDRLRMARHVGRPSCFHPTVTLGPLSLRRMLPSRSRKRLKGVGGIDGFPCQSIRGVCHLPCNPRFSTPTYLNVGRHDTKYNLDQINATSASVSGMQENLGLYGY